MGKEKAPEEEGVGVGRKLTKPEENGVPSIPDDVTATGITIHRPTAYVRPLKARKQIYVSLPIDHKSLGCISGGSYRHKLLRFNLTGIYEPTLCDTVCILIMS